MGRNVRIPKEKLLQTGLEMLIQDGYSAINITALAREAGCSTQPVAWHFGNMENFRKELAEYAVNCVVNSLKSDCTEALGAVSEIGGIYLDMAFDKPNLIKFIQANGAGTSFADGLGYIFNLEKSSAVIDGIAAEFGLERSAANEFMKAAVIYIHGLVSLISTGALDMTKQEANENFKGFAVTALTGFGVSREKAEKSMKK